MYGLIFTIILSLFISGHTALTSPVATTPLATREMSMEKRYNNEFVNNVFRDNILLTIDYLAGGKIDPKKVDWAKVSAPAEYKITLKPGETFAFHDDVLPKYRDKPLKTSNAHFNAQEGFKFSGALWGDGVCHLASLLYWTAKDAGLDAYAPVRHDFAKIPEVPAEFGVSIYANPGVNASDQQQNLYITNNRGKEVSFVFNYDGTDLKISAVESI